MTSRSDPDIVVIDPSNPNRDRGRFDPERVGRYNPNDREPRPQVTPEDVEATRAELEELKRRTRRKSA